MGKRVRITIHGKDNYQLDGDVGESTTLDAEIQPGALTICVPPQATSEFRPSILQRDEQGRCLPASRGLARSLPKRRAA
jgi:hypothetical protein